MRTQWPTVTSRNPFANLIWIWRLSLSSSPALSGVHRLREKNCCSRARLLSWSPCCTLVLPSTLDTRSCAEPRLSMIFLRQCFNCHSLIVAGREHTDSTFGDNAPRPGPPAAPQPPRARCPSPPRGRRCRLPRRESRVHDRCLGQTDASCVRPRDGSRAPGPLYLYHIAKPGSTVAPHAVRACVH